VGYWSEANAGIAVYDMELFGATKKDQKRRKELREQGPPRERIPDGHGPKELMERKLRTKLGREIYREWSTSVEPVFGQMVLRGWERFLLWRKDGGGYGVVDVLGDAQPVEAVLERLDAR